MAAFLILILTLSTKITKTEIKNDKNCIDILNKN